jgi:hypothetical protein
MSNSFHYGNYLPSIINLSVHDVIVLYKIKNIFLFINLFYFILHLLTPDVGSGMTSQSQGRGTNYLWWHFSMFIKVFIFR